MPPRKKVVGGAASTSAAAAATPDGEEDGPGGIDQYELPKSVSESISRWSTSSTRLLMAASICFTVARLAKSAVSPISFSPSSDSS